MLSTSRYRNVLQLLVWTSQFVVVSSWAESSLCFSPLMKAVPSAIHNSGRGFSGVRSCVCLREFHEDQLRRNSAGGFSHFQGGWGTLALARSRSILQAEARPLPLEDTAIIYREGTTDDGPGLVDLSLEAFDSGGMIGNMLVNVELAMQGTSLREEIEGGLSRRMMMLGEDDEETEAQEKRDKYALFVAQDKTSGKMVGMVELGILPCPVPLKRRPAPEIPYLVNLAVSQDFRRQGIARSLIAECERIAEEEWGYSEMFLHVKSNNRPARALYASMGYICELQEPMWYRLKSGQQKLRRNPRLFLRKVFDSTVDTASDEDGSAGGGTGRAYVWRNEP